MHFVVTGLVDGMYLKCGSLRISVHSRSSLALLMDSYGVWELGEASFSNPSLAVEKPRPWNDAKSVLSLLYSLCSADTRDILTH